MTQPAPLAVAPKPRRRLRWLLGAALLLGGGAGAWWWLRPAPVEPPMPANILDLEVHAAIERARQPVLAAPHSAAAWGQLGKVFMGNLFDREADFCYTRAAQLDPADPRWPYGRGRMAIKRDPDHAVPMLQQAAGLAEEWPEYCAPTQLLLAEVLLERQAINDAAAIFRRAHDRDPADARAALGLARIAVACDDRAGAVRWLAIARDSPCARKAATVASAALARAANDYARAAAKERMAANLPDDAPWPDPLMDEVVTLQTGRRGWERRVALLEQQHRYADAAALCLKRAKDYAAARAYISAGINLARLHDYDRAVPLLREGLRLEPESAHAHYSLALALFSRAERAAPTAADTAATRSDFQDALAHARSAAELRPDHARAYLFWGLALTHLGHAPDAIAPLRRGVACAPADLELQLALGEALVAAGRSSEAVPFVQNALELAPPNDPRPARALKRLGAATR